MDKSIPVSPIWAAGASTAVVRRCSLRRLLLRKRPYSTLPLTAGGMHIFSMFRPEQLVAEVSLSMSSTATDRLKDQQAFCEGAIYRTAPTARV